MKKPLCAVLAALVLAGCIALCLLWNGVVLLNNPPRDQYPVRGVDVSAYQGEIDWEILAAQDISFAFIKATEGSTFVDKHFARNFAHAQETPLAVGAYHFFSYDSPGKTQAENFISNVVPFEGMLPPVIDLEFYGDKAKNPPARAQVDAELRDMIAALTDHYGMPPIIYATEKSYALYLEGGYADCDIWIRNVVSRPRISDGRPWTFWQYTNRARLKGYEGEEKFIDVNVFSGSEAEFAAYPRYASAALSQSP